ncbi:hypothetical protein ACEWY4_025145 [Coilia grayii]|uniref:TSC22 domain family protein 4 n=1 Tax=Coilia grayii TaxID=363190 RepID=A0ABD1IZT5_9TELE
MSGGKKRSGFQITSVTSDYSQWATDSPSSQNAPVGAEGSPAAALSNGGQSNTASPSLPHRQPSTDAQVMANGPSPFLTLSPSSSSALMDRSSSQPATPVLSRRQSSTDQGAALSSSGGASRFRVVRLGQGLGEPYKRGRWTCVDQLERPEPEPRLRRVLDSMRHAHSLESLETVGLDAGGGVVGGGGGGGVGGVGAGALKPLGLPRGLRGVAGVGPVVHSQGTSHLLVAPQHLRGLAGAGAGEGARSGPPSPTHTGTEPPGLLSPPTPRMRNIPPPLRLDMDATGKFRMTQSQPSSPGPHTSGRDGLFHPNLTPIQTPSALALAQSMFGVGGAFEVDERRAVVVATETLAGALSETRSQSRAGTPASARGSDFRWRNPSRVTQLRLCGLGVRAVIAATGTATTTTTTPIRLRLQYLNPRAFLQTQPYYWDYIRLSPVNHVAKPSSHPIRAASPCRPRPGPPTPSSQSAKRLARLSVPPAADRIPSSFRTASPPAGTCPNVETVTRRTDRGSVREVKGAGEAGTGEAGTSAAAVARDVPRMRVRDSWPIGRQALAERWSLYAKTIPLRLDRPTQARCSIATTSTMSTARPNTNAALGPATNAGLGSKSSLAGGQKLSSSTQRLTTEQIPCSNEGPAAKLSAATKGNCTTGSISTRTAYPKGLVACSNPLSSTTGPTDTSTTRPTDTSTTGPTLTSATGPILTSATRLPATEGVSSATAMAPAVTTGQTITTGHNITSFTGQILNSAGATIVSGQTVASTTGPTFHSSAVGPNVSSATGTIIGSNTGYFDSSLTEPHNVSRTGSSATIGSTVGLATEPNIIPTTGPTVPQSSTGTGSHSQLTGPTGVGTIPTMLQPSPPAKAQATVAPSPGGPQSSNPPKEPFSSLGCTQTLPPCAPLGPQATRRPDLESSKLSCGKTTHACAPALNISLFQTHPAGGSSFSPQGPAPQSCCPVSCTITGALCPGLAPGQGQGGVGETKRRGEEGGLALLPAFRHKLDLPKEARYRVGSEAAFLSLVLFCRGGTGNSAMAIDNKIEQAMDLVKTHLMLAVREEVEQLREQIKELTEKNAQLERENYILKALRDRH